MGVLAVVAGACDAEVSISDAIDDTIDLVDRADGVVHSPYVVGARFELRVDADGARADGIALVSGDPSVLVLDGAGAQVQAKAVAAGTVEVSAVDAAGDVVATIELEVRAPTRVVLHAAGPVLIDRDDITTHVTTPRIVEGGVASFLVEAFDGNTPLAGHGALEAIAGPGVEAVIVPRLAGEHRDWLQLGGLGRGATDVTLSIDGQAFTRLDLEVVGLDAVADLDVFTADHAPVAIAAAYDLDGEPVHGAPFDWQLGRGAELLARDIVRYEDGRTTTLLASVGELESQTEVGEGAQDGAGCRVRGPSGPGSVGALALVVVLARRRRAARR